MYFRFAGNDWLYVLFICWDRWVTCIFDCLGSPNYMYFWFARIDGLHVLMICWDSRVPYIFYLLCQATTSRGSREASGQRRRRCGAKHWWGSGPCDRSGIYRCNGVCQASLRAYMYIDWAHSILFTTVTNLIAKYIGKDVFTVPFELLRHLFYSSSFSTCIYMCMYIKMYLVAYYLTCRWLLVDPDVWICFL